MVQNSWLMLIQGHRCRWPVDWKLQFRKCYMVKRQKTRPLDENQIKEEGLRRRAQELHIELFPEEYDHIYDSASEAIDRRQGVNPMSADYIALSNRRRAQLGFEPFMVGPEAANQDTLGWVTAKLRDGDEEFLREIKSKRNEKDAEAADARGGKN